MEGYTYWTKAAPWSILAKSSLLSERERLPTVSLLFILRPRRYRPQKGRLRLTVGNQLTQHVSFREIPVWKLKPQSWWEKVPGLMALYPLTDHRQAPPTALTHAANAISTQEKDTIACADL